MEDSRRKEGTPMIRNVSSSDVYEITDSLESKDGGPGFVRYCLIEDKPIKNESVVEGWKDTKSSMKQANSKRSLISRNSKNLNTNNNMDIIEPMNEALECISKISNLEQEAEELNLTFNNKPIHRMDIKN